MNWHVIHNNSVYRQVCNHFSTLWSRVWSKKVQKAGLSLEKGTSDSVFCVFYLFAAVLLEPHSVGLSLSSYILTRYLELHYLIFTLFVATNSNHKQVLYWCCCYESLAKHPCHCLTRLKKTKNTGIKSFRCWYIWFFFICVKKKSPCNIKYLEK